MSCADHRFPWEAAYGFPGTRIIEKSVNCNFNAFVDKAYEFVSEFGRDKICYLDGSTKSAERECGGSSIMSLDQYSVGMDIVDMFNNDPKIFVFLISTTAGGTGLNLTAANKVVIFGLWIN
jgi:Helicase conserved C-terminal domain